MLGGELASGVTGVHDTLGLDQHQADVALGDRAVLHPAWYDVQLPGPERHVTVAQLESATVPMPALPSPQDVQRNAIREQVEEIAQNQPEAIASQVAQWMKE